MNLPSSDIAEPIAGSPSTNGLSIILCCHNSAARLDRTLKALSELDLPGDDTAEIVLVDNASADSTSGTARDTWRRLAANIPMRIVFEPIPGLIHARQTGVRHAKYDLLVFCDDDNLLCRDYLVLAARHFARRPRLAAVGGFGIPLFENPPPVWFPAFASCYATGSQQITSEMGRTLNLYGAGLVIRKSALVHLYSAGYRPMLTGRNGTALSSAEDTEMTYALGIAGYELNFDDQMKFYHILPESRMQPRYLERLFLSSALDGPLRNLYHAYATQRKIPALMKYWLFHFCVAVLRIPKYLIKPPIPGYRRLHLKWNLRYITTLLRFLPGYRSARKNIDRIPTIPHTEISSPRILAEIQ